MDPRWGTNLRHVTLVFVHLCSAFPMARTLLGAWTMIPRLPGLWTLAAFSLALSGIGCGGESLGPEAALEEDLTSSPLGARTYVIRAEDKHTFEQNDDIWGVYFSKLELRDDKTFKAKVHEMAFLGDGSMDTTNSSFDIAGTYTVSTRSAPARAVFRYDVQSGGQSHKVSLRYYVKKTPQGVLFSVDRRFSDAAQFTMR